MLVRGSRAEHVAQITKYGLGWTGGEARKLLRSGLHSAHLGGQSIRQVISGQESLVSGFMSDLLTFLEARTGGRLSCWIIIGGKLYSQETSGHGNLNLQGVLLSVWDVGFVDSAFKTVRSMVDSQRGVRGVCGTGLVRCNKEASGCRSVAAVLHLCSDRAARAGSSLGGRSRMGRRGGGAPAAPPAGFPGQGLAGPRSTCLRSHSITMGVDKNKHLAIVGRVFAGRASAVEVSSVCGGSPSSRTRVACRRKFAWRSRYPSSAMRARRHCGCE